MALRDALTKLDEAVKDLTSLHVQTFSGNLDFSIDDDAGFDNIRKLLEQAKSEAKLKLVADSLVQFDGDSYNFVTEDLEELPVLVLEVHKNAVSTGIETRLGLLKLFEGLIKGTS